MDHGALERHTRGWLAIHAPELTEFRRDLHRHPELSGEEHDTARKVFERLQAAGFSPTLIPGGNGVICDFGPPEGRMVALRADMDALAMFDESNTPYRSTVPGVAHACGHDVHTTMLLGAALVLAEVADQLPGRVRLIFQPSEEENTGDPPIPGAQRMINAGALNGVDEIFALHCNPAQTVGKVGVSPGPITATGARIEVKFTGPGGHSARPSKTVNPVEVLSHVALKAPLWIARRIRAATAMRNLRAGRPIAAVRAWRETRDTVLGFNAASIGQAENVIAGSGKLVGSFRTYNEDAARLGPELLERATWAVLPRSLQRRIAALRASDQRVELTTEYIKRVQMLNNDGAAAAVLTAGAAAGLGPENVGETHRSLGGEDFAYYLDHAPGAMGRIGTASPGDEGKRDLHVGDFDVDEAVIGHGVATLVHTAYESLSRRRQPSAPVRRRLGMSTRHRTDPSRRRPLIGRRGAQPR